MGRDDDRDGGIELPDLTEHLLGPITTPLADNLYLGTPLGELYAVDWRSGAWKYLGKPFPDHRLPGLALGGDGWLYLCGGSSQTSMLARYHLTRGHMEFIGPIRHADGTHLHYVHEIAAIDGKIYAVETDNPERSGYLWVCDVHS